MTPRSADWYVWRDRTPDGAPPNNWRAAFADDEPAWTLDDATGQWYLHLFLPEQPDLNWDEPAVETAMHDVLRFWLDRGVDGFRADVLHAIGKGPDLPDDPEEYIPIPHSALNHVPEVTFPRLRRIRELLDSYDGDRMMVGEVYLLDTALVAQYYDGGRGIHLSFNFPPLFAPWDAGAVAPSGRRGRGAHRPPPAGPPGCCRTTTTSGTSRGTAARPGPGPRCFLTVGLRGTPFLYAGEELGLEDADDPGGPGRRPGGPRRLPGPDPVDAGRRPRLGRRPLAAVPARGPTTGATPRACGTTRARSSTSTGGCWRPGGPPRPWWPAIR